MWQTAVVLLIVAGVMIYLVRHYTKVYRGEAPACSSCSECCQAREQADAVPCECTGARAMESPGNRDRSQA